MDDHIGPGKLAVRIAIPFSVDSHRDRYASVLRKESQELMTILARLHTYMQHSMATGSAILVQVSQQLLLDMACVVATRFSLVGSIKK